MIREIREMMPDEPEPQMCSALRQFTEQLLNEYQEAIAICCRDAVTPCFNNQSVRVILENYAEKACHVMKHQPSQLEHQFGVALEAVPQRMRQDLEELLSPCFAGPIPR